jgi:hypothetical protein
MRTVFEHRGYDDTARVAEIDDAGVMRDGERVVGASADPNFARIAECVRVHAGGLIVRLFFC